MEKYNDKLEMEKEYKFLKDYEKLLVEYCDRLNALGQEKGKEEAIKNAIGMKLAITSIIEYMDEHNEMPEGFYLTRKEYHNSYKRMQKLMRRFKKYVPIKNRNN